MKYEVQKQSMLLAILNLLALPNVRPGFEMAWPFLMVVSQSWKKSTVCGHFDVCHLTSVYEKYTGQVTTHKERSFFHQTGKLVMYNICYL